MTREASDTYTDTLTDVIEKTTLAEGQLQKRQEKHDDNSHNQMTREASDKYTDTLTDVIKKKSWPKASSQKGKRSMR